jgi:hypothetical protein
MGPEPVMGFLSLLGIGVAALLLLQIVRKKHVVLVLSIVTVSAVFAWVSSQGQVASKFVFIFFMFFGIFATCLSAISWVFLLFLKSRRRARLSPDR